MLRVISRLDRSIVIYISSKKNTSTDTPSLLVVTLSQPSGALLENTAATLAPFLPFRKWRGHATVLPVSATHPLRPTDNSPGVLGFPVDCRQEWASFGGHNAFTTLLLQVERRKGEPPILGGVVYRDYVRGIAIHRTKGRAVLSPFAFLFRYRCSRHACDTNCCSDSRQRRAISWHFAKNSDLQRVSRPFDRKGIHSCKPSALIYQYVIA